MFESVHSFFASIARWIKRHKAITIISLILLTFFTGGVFILVSVVVLFFASPFVCMYYLVYLIKTYKYYRTDDFIKLKKEMSKKISEYNEFKSFMYETKEYISNQQSLLTTGGNVRNSTLTVYKNSKLDIYKYIVKYFFKNKNIDEESIQTVERVLQKYNTLEKTYDILSSEYKDLTKRIREEMYSGAYLFSGLTMKKLGTTKLPKFEQDYYMCYSFDYTSPADRKHYSNKIVLDDAGLQSFAEYLNSIIKYKKSVKYQRQLMTPELRSAILARDKYTCKMCSISTKDEPHLLLEVDHMLPISKGGITIESNLQALCWKCNRSKANKIIENLKEVFAKS